MTAEEIATIAISDDSSDSYTNSNQAESTSSRSRSSSVQDPPPKQRNTAVKKGTPAPQHKPPVKKDLNLLQGTRFLDDFNPQSSRREKNKRFNFTKPPKLPKKATTLYDELGRIRLSQEDVCDCFDADCPGCHFPCESCSSEKCGSKCRVNRKWQYEEIKYDGGNNVTKTNPLLTTVVNRN